MNDSSQYRRTLLALAAAIGLLLILSGCGRDDGREVQGNVISVRGAVAIESGKESGGHPHSVTIASKLSVGDRLETSPDAMASLSLIPGIFVEVGASAEIVIGELRVQKRGDAMVDAIKSRLATLQLNHGVIRASLPDIGSGRCELNVQTDLGTAVVQRGALASVRLMNEMVRVVCVDGEVAWSSARGGPVDKIPEGYFRGYRRHDGGGNEEARLRPVSEDAEAQADVAATLETAAAFDDFVLRARNAPAPKSSHPIKRQAAPPP
jgi:hypothetical protein